MMVFAASMTCSVMPARASNPNLKYFGYVGVDAGIVDIQSPKSGNCAPGDLTGCTYDDDVKTFSNLAHLSAGNGPSSPLFNVVSRLAAIKTDGMGAIAAPQGPFWTPASSCTPLSPAGGRKLTLRSDYSTVWSNFLTTNAAADVTAILAFYIADEPVWNGVSSADLTTVANLVHSSLPTIAILYVEAGSVVDGSHPTLYNSMVIPTAVTHVGFDKYGVLNPSTDTTYLTALSNLKAKRTNSQAVLLIMDSSYLYSGEADIGLQSTDIKTMDDNYLALAQTDSSIIGMMGYAWPGGLGQPTPGVPIDCSPSTATTGTNRAGASSLTVTSRP